MTSVETIRVRPAHDDDRAAWTGLFVDYCAAGGVTADAAHVARVWAWLQSPDRASQCLLADSATTVVGFAHVRAFDRPITATTGLWLDDLYVADHARGRGVARTLVEAVRRTAAQQGHDVVRWTTRTTNAAALALYGRVAEPADVVVYNATPLV